MISSEVVSKYVADESNSEPRLLSAAIVQSYRIGDFILVRDARGKNRQLTSCYVTMPPSPGQMKPSETRNLSRSQSIEDSTDDELAGSRRKRRLTVYDAVAGK